MAPSNSTEPKPARIHLLPAKAAPLVVVIRRKPSRQVHILRWNTHSDEFEHGSWFKGRVYEMQSDISFDGEHMVYLAMGATGETWSGICRPPFLKTLVHWPNTGTWYGGGLFRSPTLLEINPGYALGDARKVIEKVDKQFPFGFGIRENPGYGEDLGVLFPRFERDGFRRLGPMGKETDESSQRQYRTSYLNDPGWVLRPTPSHPELRVRYRGYAGGTGRDFEWDLPEHPGLLDEHVSWAAYDALGQLIVARLGVLTRYCLADLLTHTPSAVFDLESLEPPARPSEPPHP